MENLDNKIIQACKKEKTMSKAAKSLEMKFHVFSKKAKELGCYKPNQSGKGTFKKNNGNLIPLEEILSGMHPQYQTNKIRLRLIESKIKEKKCEICNITEWNGKEVSFELDHIDGNSTNHLLENLRILCPNCHSQTSTYRGKNIKNNCKQN